jgi:hypothetical protein
MTQEKDEITGSESAPPSLVEKPKLPVSAHVICGWPLLLVAIGGAIGGGLGGAAYGINVAIYKSKLPIPAKIALNGLVGLAAVAIWIAIAMVIQLGRKS